MANAKPEEKKAPGTALALMAQRLAVAPVELEHTLMQTAFKGSTPAEFLTLVAVANQYGLNPLVREIYAFAKEGRVTPIIGFDGWAKLIRTDPDFAGWEFSYADEVDRPDPQAKDCPVWCEVTIHHKSHPELPTTHREYLDELYRPTGPWRSNTKRLLKWKTISQAGRLAFGLSGIYDPDEAERIAAGEIIEGRILSEEQVQPLGELNWQKLLKACERECYTEADVMANAAILGYEGSGPDMPEDIAQKIYAAAKANPKLDASPEEGE
jgi:hypothetical protein